MKNQQDVVRERDVNELLVEEIAYQLVLSVSVSKNRTHASLNKL